MINISALIKSYLDVFRSLKPLMRTVDSRVEAVERELKRLVARRKALPDQADLTRLTAMVTQIETDLKPVKAVLKKGYPKT